MVQGAGAAVRIATALAEFDADPEIDVIVLARGGGSVEDLLPFSSEAVCRAVSACRHPGGVGRRPRAGSPPGRPGRRRPRRHSQPGREPDRARPRIRDGRTRRADGPGHRGRSRVVARAAESCSSCWSHGPPSMTPPPGSRCDGCRSTRAPRRSAGAPPTGSARERTALDHARDRLRLLGPAATLERGYAVVLYADGAVISDASTVAVDAPVGVRLARGSLAATVTEVRP